MAFEFNNPIISKMRKGDSSDPFIPYSILLQIVNGKVVLPEKPNQFERVRVTSPNGAEILYENISGTPKANEFYVDYTNSVVYFDSSRNNTQMVFTFKGEGLQYIPSSIVYTSNDGTQVTQTLDEYVEDSKSQIDQKVASVDADVQRMLSDGNTKIDEMDAKISEANTAISGATTATQNANASSASATNAASAANSAATTTQIIWKSPVTNYADIATTYPSPSVGWSVQVTSTNDRYRYDGSAWVKIANYSTTGLETTSNVQIIDSAKASIVRDSIYSGFTQLSPITYYTTTANKFKLSQDSVAYINGYKVTIPANTDVTTPTAPTFGTQTDVFWLEAYLDSTGYQMTSSVQSKSNITDLSGAGFTKDSKDVGLWKKTDATKKDGYVYAIEMFSIRRCNSGGYRKDNLNGSRTYISTTLSAAASTSSSDVTVASVTGLSVGDSIKIGSTSIYKINAINGTTITLGRNADSAHASGSSVVLQSDRPDGNYADIITSDDITDLRHQVSLTGFDKNYLLSQSMESLSQGKSSIRETVKEVFNLKPAPMGLKQELVGVDRLGNDGVTRSLVNLLGTDGNFENGYGGFSAYTGSMTAQNDTDYYVGSKSIKLTSSIGSNLYYGRQFNVVANKYYLIAGNAKSSVATAKIGTNYGDSNNITSGSWGYVYKKIQPTSTTLEVRLHVNGAIGSAWYDGIRIYEIDQATHDKIDVLPEFTGEELAKKFPYVDSYPNFVENLLPSFDSGLWTLHPNAKVDNPYQLTLTATANLQASYVDVNCFGSTQYSIICKHSTTNQWVQVDEFDSSGIKIRNGTIASNSSTYTFTTLSNATRIRVLLFNYGTTSGTHTFSNVQLEQNSTPNQFVPFGRHYLPYDYAAGTSKYNITESFNGHRKVFSDAQMSDVVNDKIEVLKTPQKHIKVTQATEGTWAVNDTIQVNSSYGVVSGVIDADTALATVTESASVGATTIKLNDVSKLAVNDTIKLWDGISDNTSWNTFTITAIDATNKIVTLNAGLGSGGASAGMYVTETTASTSSPVVTAAGIAGTWSGLGTKSATYTITTAPTDNKTDILLQYAVNYPAGKGLQYLPSEVLEGEVNGQKLISGETVSAKANFEGKVAGSTDANPHYFKYIGTSHSTLASPSDGWMDRGQSDYNFVFSLDGSVKSSADSTAGAIAQQLFSFDIISLMERKYGEGFFADCASVADKVAKLKSSISQITCDWYGYGSSVGGNKAIFNLWYNNSWTIAQSLTHSNATVTKLPYTLQGISNFNNTIDSNGFIHFLAYAEPSDGTTASTVYTDYVELSVNLNVAENGYVVFQPESKFPAKATGIDSKKLATFDYANKTTSSIINVPHRALYKSSATFDTPSTYTTEFGATAYNAIGTQNGTLVSGTESATSTIGNYQQQVYEIDFSNRQMSLSEIKKALRKFTLTVVGYGSGDSSSVLTYGLTVKVYDNTTSTWVQISTGSASTPETLTWTETTNSSLQKYVDKNQKVYILVHSTYPASSTLSSSVLLDYIKFELTLADYVDIITSGIVLVNPTTKEIKLKYSNRSYKYVGNGGDYSQIGLNYRFVPANGSQLGNATLITSPKDYIITTYGTGNATNVPTNSKYKNLAYRILNNDGYVYNLLSENLYSFSDANVETGIKKFIVDTVYSTGARIGDVIGNNVTPFVSQLPSVGNANYLALSCALVSINGQIYLRVFYKYKKDMGSFINLNNSIDFVINGRPLIK